MSIEESLGLQDLKPGDYGVTRTGDTVGAIIRLFTRSKVNHAFTYVGDGKIIEASRKGMSYGNLGDYPAAIFYEKELTDEQRDLILTTAKAQLGTKYGFLDILFLGLSILGMKWGWLRTLVHRQNRLICSQAVSLQYEAAGIQLVPGKDPMEITPGDLLDVVVGCAIPKDW